MAITNAQQYKQLVNPPMKGNKRPGYRGECSINPERAMIKVVVLVTPRVFQMEMVLIEAKQDHNMV